MRWLFIILCFASCYSKRIEKLERVDEDTMVIWESKLRTEAMINELPKVDEVIHKEEARIEHDLKSLKNELQTLQVSQKVAKVVYIHDTIVIKEKTNFWGRKRVSMDSMQSIDSIEYK